jgi:hypothetical protein
VSAPVNAPEPAVRRLGQRLLLLEVEQGEVGVDGRPAATAVAAAAERAARKLGQPLARLVGVAGCQALLTRALHLAGREWPFLEGARAVAAPAGGLEGLGEALQGADPAQVRDALASLLAHLVWLLVTFIGGDLALHTVREAWPGTYFGDEVFPGTGRSETGRLHKGQLSGEAGPAGAEATT